MFEWILYNTRELLRDKTSLFFTVVFPILMVGVLGTMLSGADTPDSSVGTIRIAYSAADGADGMDIEKLEELSQRAQSADGVPAEEWAALAQSDPDLMERYANMMIVDMFAETLAESSGLELTEAADAGAARAAAESGEADAALIFGSPMSVEVAEGEDVIKNRAVHLIAQGFAREYAAYTAYAASAAQTQQPPANPFESIEMEDPWDLSALVADKDLGVSRSMMDFYAVTMIVMIAFMGGGIGGAFTMYQARKDGLLRRMVCSPRSRTRLFLEAVVGVIPQNILQALIVMILSTVFLGVHYAKTWQENLLLFAFFIVVGMAVTAVFMLIGLFVRVNPYMPLMGGLWALLFMSGSFSKDMVIDGVSEYLPPNIIQRAAFDLTLFGRAEQMWTVMAVCGALLAFACALGVVIFRKKEIVF